VTFLLDANVLIALVVEDHVHHQAAESWLAGTDQPFASCPITQGSLVRLLVREGQPAATATAIMSALSEDPRHEFWSDNISYRDVTMKGVIGHRQVTDAYLAQLARAYKGRLATFDRGLATLHSDIVELLATA
jgi:uncharacterized protein